ncbi:cholesterol 25-hydroxylase-like protein 2 [Latimeria chalumnae]|uniref:cholesterol 25-hydroxylase-like protein 2 n=1 Tax=Latimeria chalumnae TaxID=7897 RepID=UPI0003C14F0E|nr:PREDICTED: cholesterol 25-hydroxylase-like protein 2 [Latimeria chalumnae]|eukprot:XP_005992706.1 PREDICTED: cholesterol 25-hydroxylase-like protein 2 [Latimeria chalumnae]
MNSPNNLFEFYFQTFWNGNITDFMAEGSLLQPIWDHLRFKHEDRLRSPLFPVVLSISVYFILAASFMILDVLAPKCPSINKYRIHPEKPVAWKNIGKTLWLTTYNHLVYIFPAAVAQWYWRPPIPLPEEAPTLYELICGVLGCLILFDFQYYIWHLLHHKIRWLYTTFHAIHHEFYEPFSWVTQYLSAWELFCVGFWTTLDPLILQCHCLTTWTFMILNICISIDDHCGYDFPWSLHNIIPWELWGGSVKHNLHHQKPMSDFAPFFSHWDWLCGTSSSLQHSAGVEEVKKSKRKGKKIA